jgi:transcriptional regulator GlxA family with amidase domain
MRYLSSDQQSHDTVARLAEVFVGHAIRHHLECSAGENQGWIGGLKDPAVARALSVIHSRYAEDLDVEMLAREAGVSRSVLGERFVELLGEPPMRYCAKWRMRTAANMLRDGNESSAKIAYSVGFCSEAAFNRAFKREFGEPPVTWKRKAEEQERAAKQLAQRSTLPRQVVESEAENA